MLQQTQMERGVSYFNRWMRRFPTIESVALASEDEILNLWEGLGYYRRARNLHKTAKLITSQYNGIFPADHTTILSLPGIGPYTAAAISSIAFKKPIPVLDANVIRVLSRIFDVSTPVATSATRNMLIDHATDLLPPGHARDFNQALMELGALVCTKTPVCLQCPLKSLCNTLDKGTILERPVLRKPPSAIPITMASGVLVHEGRIFIQKRCTHDDLWAGLWEFPGGTVISGEHPRDAVIREFLEETELAIFPLQKIAVIKHSYTRYRVTLHAYFCGINGLPRPILHAAQQYKWLHPAELTNYAFSSGHRKLMDMLIANPAQTAAMG
jgi:A/G-specific adenine glycosylase